MQKNANFCILTLLHLSTYQIGAYVNFRQNSQKLNVQASVRTCCILTGLIFRRDTRDEIRTMRSDSPTTAHQSPFLLFARKKPFFTHYPPCCPITPAKIATYSLPEYWKIITITVQSCLF